MQASLWDILKVLVEPFTRGQIWLLIPLAFALLFIPAWNADVMTGASTVILWALRQVKGLVTQSCPTLCNLMDYSLPGSFISGILQARILEGVATSFFRGSSQPRDWPQVSHIAGSLPSEPPGKPLVSFNLEQFIRLSLSLATLISWKTTS